MICKKCNKPFEPWAYNINCTWMCENGIYHEEREDGSLIYVDCPGCKGIGYEKYTEKELCISCWQDADLDETFP